MLYFAEACSELAGPSMGHCARALQLLSKKCRSGGESLATLCQFDRAGDLNLRLTALEMNARYPATNKLK